MHRLTLLGISSYHYQVYFNADHNLTQSRHYICIKNNTLNHKLTLYQQKRKVKSLKG